MTDKSALVLGGAGFIGSHLAAALCKTNFKVTIIDGLLAHTGGDKCNLDALGLDNAELVFERVERIHDLTEIVESSDFIFDLMALTSHQFGFENLAIDADLNLMPHIALIMAMKEASYRGHVVYFGSRGQYGAVSDSPFDEASPLHPLDPQGIHKTAAERLFEVYSRRVGFSCDSLRITNCYGPRQKIKGDEVGLVAQFIRDLLLGREVQIFGSGERTKDLLFVDDLVHTILQLVETARGGFQPLNVGGRPVSISDLLEILQEKCKKGSYSVKPFPDDLLQSDTGDAIMCTQLLEGIIGSNLRCSDLSESLGITVIDIRNRLELGH